MRAKIVIDLGFGDSGKGITTDYLCSSFADVVIRFSGGQQAGHCVTNEKGKHTFASYGSGSLRGVPTYISEHCTFYPPFILNERETLTKLTSNPRLYLHPLAMCTTPYDIAYNRWKSEKSRDTCGMGIGATMKRNNDTPYRLFACDLTNDWVLRKKMTAISMYYMKITEANNDYLWHVDDLLGDFWDSIRSEHIKRILVSITGYDFRSAIKDIVFEGSQGIMLDMEHGIFPDVTYAHTTSRNALEICRKMGIKDKDIDIFYVTRCYQTRHGHGPMSSDENISLVHNSEEINTFNQWQGHLRVREIDYDLLNYALLADSAYAGNHIRKNLVVTCLDQRPLFKMDYTKFNTKFYSIYESRSPITKLERVGELIPT